MRRKICAAAVLLLAFTVVFSACSLNKKGNNAEIDASEAVITIGDESVSLAMYKALFDSYLPYMQYSGQDPYENESTLSSFRAWLVDILSDDLVTLYQAKKAGFELTGEQEAQLEAETESDIEELYANFMKLAEQSFTDDPSIPVTAYFESIVNSESEYYTGIAMSWEDYKEHYRSESRHSAIVRAYRDAVCAEFVPKEEDIEDWYEETLASDKAYYASNPEKYKTDQELFEQYFGQRDAVYPITSVPSGYSRVMQIVVTPSGELSSEYGEKIARMDELKKEYAELAFEDAVNGSSKNEERITEILNEYRALKASTDAEYDSYVEEARTKIDDALAALHAGEDFASVMLRFTEDVRITGDENSEGCAAFREKGELISLEYKSQDDFSEVFKEEFKKLVQGQYSNVFMDGDSFKIIYYASDEQSGDVPMENIYDSIKAVCTAAVQDAQWEELLAEWKKDPALTINEDLIKTVGKSEED